jgi:ADP-ribose pyrophosphatase YjhB (NUDIX family)
MAIQNDKILAVKRKKDPYKGLYWLPWWHIEEWETQIEALKREVKEETNQVIWNIKYITAITDNTNHIYVYAADIIWKTDYEVEDDWVEHSARITISEFIDGFNKYNVVWREELIDQLNKYMIENNN